MNIPCSGGRGVTSFFLKDLASSAKGLKKKKKKKSYSIDPAIALQGIYPEEIIRCVQICT